MRRIVIDELQCFLDGRRDSHLKPVRSDRLRQDFAQGNVVVDKQQLWSNIGIPTRRSRHRVSLSFPRLIEQFVLHIENLTCVVMRGIDARQSRINRSRTELQSPIMSGDASAQNTAALLPCSY